MLNNQIKVKISTRFPYWDYKRQTPNSSGTWKNLDFHIDDNTKECDWYIVFGGIQKKEKILCYPENTILITDEPSSVKKYNAEFIKQFNTIITIQKNIEAKNIINKQILPWYIGAQYNKEKKTFNQFNKSYDELKNKNPILKTKLISVISSNKNKTEGHKERLRFIKILKKHFGEKIDVFGVGINEIQDKWDAVALYKYNIVLENSIEKDYWSEKLQDAFLGESYPIYYGCPNIQDYFETNSLSTINISKPKNAIKIIEEIIENDYYHKHNDNILKAKEKILDKYQMFPQIYEVVNSLKNKIKNDKKIWIEIKPEIIEKDTAIKKYIGKIGIFIKKISPNLYLKIKNNGKF